ncbi:SUN domain-containing protein 1 Protein unc-84 -like protein A Sad1/unc-84 protein-like 1 [Channa argus]|uniref:SUN domain-containing protein 1 Protein unc-84-like protein A Sad1/unc-84 protein-like 1 n=1 Tax=Channa argus TaxID=215402 RepID=A0A6G1PD75_CHAAH|nr:SUN domain-containing protein 1 Protein unc-84 -like protein A Sad1/unc-84 protein-like 1 [Channa argus]KAK2918638.1 hypothetical protein Q8A73_003009 [Channa argus]
MTRRSSRLVSGGYYNSDEESDSSTVTNISYRENPVKVFKKKSGTRKSGSRTSSHDRSNVSLPSPEPPAAAGQSTAPSPPPPSSQTPSVVRTTPYVLTPATPRPALTPSSSRSQTPVCYHALVPGKGTGLFSSSRPALHPMPDHKGQRQTGVDSSGYSSSEGTYKKPTAATSTASRITSSSGASPGYKSKISSAFFSLMDSLSLKAAAAQLRIRHLAALANTSFSSRMKKAFGLFLLLLLLILLCIWFILPWLTAFISRMAVTKTLSQTKPTSQPVIPATQPLQPNIIHSTPVVDPALVSAAVEAKMQNLLAELQVKQEQLLSQMKDRIQLDMLNMKTKLEAVDVDSRLHLEQEVAALNRQIADYQTASRGAAASLSLRIQSLEDQNAKLSQELLSIQLIPSPEPHPDTSATTVHNHITPELHQALEKWLADRIKEQDVIKLVGKEGSSDWGRPMADKMADFALETQGASVISTRCSETYRIRSACVTLFGFPLWYPSESPRTVIQGYPVLLPGKCWAFHGAQGTLLISLSHPVTITHVTVDHLPRYNSPTGRIDSAPKDFEVYGMKNESEEGTLLGTFTYDENGDSTQTFKLPNPTDEVYRYVEMLVLSNWGHIEYTCLYRFRVHGKIAST